MTAKLISRIRVVGLFGLYTYDIPKSGVLQDAAILYGDNGVGKSTVLRLVFHLFSAANNRGHRTALYSAEFQRLEVELSSGITLTAHVVESEPSKLLRLEVLEGQNRLTVWDYRLREAIRFEEGEGVFVEVDERGRHMIHRRAAAARKKESEEVPRGEQPYLERL